MSHLPLSENIIQSANIQTRDHRYSFGKHIHENIEVYYILQGECRMDIGNKNIACAPGNFVMVMPNTVHSFYLTTDTECRFMHIHFNPDFFDKLLIEHAGSNTISLLAALNLSLNFYYYAERDSLLYQYVSDIIRENASGTALAKSRCALNLTRTLIYILKSFDSPFLQKSGKESVQSSYVAFAVRYVHEHCREKILIQDIADRLHISSRHLSQVFVNQMNLTLATYINTVKINQSTKLLTETDMSISEISAAIGLKHVQHFSKLFYSYIGITPYKYRQLLKNKSI